MKIIASFKHDGKPQRQLLTLNGRTYRRIVCTAPVPVWQERIFNGDWHNAVSEEKNLESIYQAEIPAEDKF
jgi:hypothetical protein